jgi:hypothetical protein
MHATPPSLSSVVNLASEGAGPVVLPPVAEASKSIGDRSLWLGRSIARKLANSTPLDRLGGCIADKDQFLGGEFDIPREYWDALHRALKQLAVPGGIDESSLGSVLAWAAEQTREWETPLRETCLLKPLMPLYLASAMAPEEQTEAQRTAASQTQQLLLEMIGMLELNRALEHVGFQEWMKHRVRGQEDLGQWIHRGLKVDLHTMSHAMKERWARNQGEASSQTAIPRPLLERDHHHWWSLAWQWSQAKTALMVPVGLPVIVRPWDQLISHWKSIYKHLVHSEQTDSPKLIEIRSASDGQLGNSLDRWLEDVRSEQGTLSLLAVRFVGDLVAHPKSQDAIAWWQTVWLKCLGAALDESHPRGFVTDTGDIGVLYKDQDRTALSQHVREAFDKMQRVLVATKCLAENRPVPLNAGIASVHAPAKSFRMQHLMDAAWRCLGNATSQGPGAVKSIEVF